LNPKNFGKSQNVIFNNTKKNENLLETSKFENYLAHVKEFFRKYRVKRIKKSQKKTFNFEHFV